jgi:hypothetical protein
VLVLPPRIGARVSAILAVACGASMLGDRDRWLGVWALTDTDLNIALMFAIPAAAGCGAWIGALVRRSGLHDLADFGARSRLRVETRLAVELMVWLTLGLLASTAVAWIDTARFARVMSPQPSLVLARLAIVWFAGVLGLLIGRRLPAMVAVPSAVVAPYILVVALTYFADPLLAALTPVDGGVTPFSTINLVPTLLQTVAWLLATVALVVLVGRRPRWGFLCAWLAGLIAAPLILIGPADRDHLPEAAEPDCERSDRVMVCLPRTTAYLDSELAEDISRVSDVLEGLAPRRAAWIDEDVEWGATPNLAWAAVQERARSDGYDLVWVGRVERVGVYTQLNHDKVRAQLAAALVPQPTHFDSHGDLTPVSPNEAILHWAFERAGASLSGQPDEMFTAPREADNVNRDRMRWFADLSRSARAEFLSTHSAEIEHGTLAWSAFGRA